MCVVSMVHDHYWKRFPEPVVEPAPVDWSTWLQQPAVDLAALRKLVDEFKEAVEAAKKVDILTKQPDCVDPEKAKLQQRVAELEKKLAAIQEAASSP